MEKLFTLLLSFLAMYVSAQNKDSVSVLTKGYIISGELRDAGLKKIYLREISFYKEEGKLLGDWGYGNSATNGGTWQMHKQN